jgi:predicted amidohydrolase
MTDPAAPCTTLKAACIQNSAQADMAASLDEAEALAADAVSAGAELICFPEYFGCLHAEGRAIQTGAAPEDGHPVLERFRAFARAHARWTLLGSIAVDTGEERIRNRSVLLNPAGEIAARYDKIHMFDVNLKDGETYRESAQFAPGGEAVVAETPWGGLGLTVCYDLRFAYLYRALAQAGARILTCPAAFMKTTGEAHWHVLLRARAIETGCFVLAPCQYGTHGSARTYGHSLIVAPWGEVIADAGENAGYALAELDLSKVDEARAMVPALEHDRAFDVSAPTAAKAAE